MNILVTGATGNVGKSVITHLCKTSVHNGNIFAGVRDVAKSEQLFSNYKINFKKFDFEDSETFESALDNIDCVFLLRPPHLADVKKYFEPLLEQMVQKEVKKVVFLSVQGAEKSEIIPHHKIEKYIIKKGLEYIFLRPSYFMQNLTTTLFEDIQKYNEIILPSGHAKFNWVDVENIAEIAAITINNFNTYSNTAIEVNGNENLDFYQVTDLINTELKTQIKYKSVNPISYFLIRMARATSVKMIFIMIMLHFFPRFENDPRVSTSYKNITGKEPTTLKEFLQRESSIFEM